MNITYSNSYARPSGYVANITTTEDSLTVSLYYEVIGNDIHPQHLYGESYEEVLEGIDIHMSWEGRRFYRYSTLTLDIDQLRKLPSWQDRSVWTGSGQYIPDSLFPRSNHIKLWHNITSETTSNKVVPTNHYLHTLRTSPIDIGSFLLFVPFKNSELMDCSIHILSMIDGIPHLFNGHPVGGDAIDPLQSQMIAMPKLAIDGPDTIEVDGNASLKIQLTDHSGSPLKKECIVYLEAVSGYIPQQRIQLIDGVGYARVMAIGLLPLERMRVKVGFKYWSGDDEHAMTVVQ